MSRIPIEKIVVCPARNGDAVAVDAECRECVNCLGITDISVLCKYTDGRD
jgi:hypothetical protein